MPGDRFGAWERLRLPLAAWRYGADLLHCPANTCPSWMPIPTVVTIHDLVPLDMPQGLSPLFVNRFRTSVVVACRRAAGIICPSSYTRDRLVNEFGADPGRITVNPWAADSSVKPVPREQCDRIMSRYQIWRPFALHFGSGEPRKNTRRVVEAWAMADRSIRRHWTLLIVGLDRAARVRLGKVAAALGVAESVVLEGFAAEDDLPALLSAAGVLVYPSLSEGFGLPILDAWTARTAVLTSAATSLPEVAGDAAMLIDPLDVCAIARGLSRLLQDSRLREDLVQRGQKRLRQYTWQSTAQRFIDALERAAAFRRLKRAA